MGHSLGRSGSRTRTRAQIRAEEGQGGSTARTIPASLPTDPAVLSSGPSSLVQGNPATPATPPTGFTGRSRSRGVRQGPPAPVGPLTNLPTTPEAPPEATGRQNILARLFPRRFGQQGVPAPQEGPNQLAQNVQVNPATALAQERQSGPLGGFFVNQRDRARVRSGKLDPATADFTSPAFTDEQNEEILRRLGTDPTVLGEDTDVQDNLDAIKLENFEANPPQTEEEFREFLTLQGFSPDVVEARTGEEFGRQQLSFTDPFSGATTEFSLRADDNRLISTLGITEFGQIDSSQSITQLENPETVEEFLFNVSQQSPETQGKLAEAAAFYGGPSNLFEAINQLNFGSIASFIRDEFGPDPSLAPVDGGVGAAGFDTLLDDLLTALGLGSPATESGAAETTGPGFEPVPLQISAPAGDPGFATATAPPASTPGAGGSAAVTNLLTSLLGPTGGDVAFG